MKKSGNTRKGLFLRQGGSTKLCCQIGVRSPKQLHRGVQDVWSRLRHFSVMSRQFNNVKIQTRNNSLIKILKNDGRWNYRMELLIRYSQSVRLDHRKIIHQHQKYLPTVKREWYTHKHPFPKPEKNYKLPFNLNPIIDGNELHPDFDL